MKNLLMNNILLNDTEGIYPVVHPQDLEPVSIIKPDLKDGPWIAGGAALKWYQNSPVDCSDIDVFCKTPQQAQQVLADLTQYGRHSMRFHSENAITLDYNNAKWEQSWTVQIITRRFFDRIEQITDSFDITVCEIATAGSEWILGPYTARDIRNRCLRFKQPLQTDSVKRLIKYWSYGFRPVPGTIDLIANDSETKWTFSGTEDYENAF